MTYALESGTSDRALAGVDDPAVAEPAWDPGG
jgi:hypothetical protein